MFHRLARITLLLTGLANLTPALAAEPFFQKSQIAVSDETVFAYPCVERLANDKLMCVFSVREPARNKFVVAASYSADHGATWGAPITLIDTPEASDYDPSLVVIDETVVVTSTAVPLANRGRIMTSRTVAIRSTDNAQTWSQPYDIPMGRRYTSGKVNKGLQLADQAALFGFTWERNLESVESLSSEGEMHEVSAMMITHDAGRTWVAGGDMNLETPKLSDRKHAISGVCEPAIVECSDGSLLTLLRTGLENLYQARSTDGGKTWSQPTPSPLTGHNAPAALCRVDGERPSILAVWNNSPRDRWPLSATLSFDDGVTWTTPRNITYTPGKQSSYPGCVQAADGALVIVYQQDRPDHRPRAIHGIRCNVAWLQHENAREPKILDHFDEMPKPAQLHDGRLAAFFVHGGGPGLPPVPEIQHVSARFSSDNGDTWSDPKQLFTLPPEAGGFGYFTVLVDQDGAVHLFFLNDNNEGVIRRIYDENGRIKVKRLAQQRLDIWHVKSNADVSAWGAPKPIWTGRAGDPMAATQLTNGRILLPLSYLTPRNWSNRGTEFDAFTYKGQFNSTVLYSDDDGDTWIDTDAALSVPTHTLQNYGAIEPVAIQLTDGRIWMLVRTQLGYLYESFSADGVHWPPLTPSQFRSSDSPGLPIRLPDGRMVLIWNNCLRFPYALGGRHVLHAAISSDEGRTWCGFREIARDPLRNEPPPPSGDHGISYAFATVTDKGDIVWAPWVSTGQGRPLFRLDPDWLEQTSQSDDFTHGQDHWSSFGTRGVEIVNDTPGATTPQLQVRKADPDWPSAAVWNFPMGASGRLKLRIMLKSRFGGATIGLTDHFSTPFDQLAPRHNVYNVTISPAGNLAGHIIEPNRWVDLIFKWEPNGQCQIVCDGALIASVDAQRRFDGLSYLRLSSDASTPDDGILLDSVEVDIRH